jgi:hypothetical protein
MKRPGPTLPGLEQPHSETSGGRAKDGKRAIYCFYCIRPMVVIEKREHYDVYGCTNPACGRSRQSGLEGL